MTKNEIKKELYKQKPMAKLLAVYDKFCSYETTLEDGTLVIFDIPNEEMTWENDEDIQSQLLIRWMV